MRSARGLGTSSTTSRRNTADSYGPDRLRVARELKSYDEIIGYTALATPKSGRRTRGRPTRRLESGRRTQGPRTRVRTPARIRHADSFHARPPRARRRPRAHASRAVASAFAGAKTAAAANRNRSPVVGDPPTNAALVTFRIIHYHGDDVAYEPSPTTQKDADERVGMAVIPEAAKNKAGGRSRLASNDSYTTRQTTPLPVSAPGVLGNDVGVINDPSAIRSLDRTAGKRWRTVLTFNPNGSFEYRPKGNSWGSTTSATLRRKAAPLTSAIATVRIRFAEEP